MSDLWKNKKKKGGRINEVSGLTISPSVSSFPVDMFDFISFFIHFIEYAVSIP